MLKTPPLQTATATIDTLCGRLQSATLLEDRRAAILGLRSFAKQYPASVASGSLRELIATLKRDGLGQEAQGSDRGGRKGSAGATEEGGDVDTIRLVLETLLMLFNPDSNSPEASEEMELFMADGFSMRQDNITVLLSLLDITSPYADYYSRLYSLQLLSAICAARPDRLQECILSAPLGVSRLVGVLDDSRDAVRNAGLLLLVDLTSGANEDLRKIVAFEDVFGKVFALIRSEGGLAEAGITAQDCLSLLANLIKGSASNQTMFRESGCVTQMVRLLQEAFPSDTPEVAFVAQGREKATWGLLQLLGLFLESGEQSTPQNQAAFFRAGTAQVLIDLGFCPLLPPPIRTLALKCGAGLIAFNPPLQEAFAPLMVETPAQHADVDEKAAGSQVNGTRSGHGSAKGSARTSAETSRTYVIEALLDLTLTRSNEDTGLRQAACGLTQAYLTGHERIKQHFLNRAIVGHAEHESAANALNTLLHPDDTDAASVVFASSIVSDLISEQPEAKAALAAVKEGNESEGEDVFTFIQALGSQLQAAVSPADERLIAAYACLLTVLLWEFAPGVDDLLAEGSGLLQTLMTAAVSGGSDVVSGSAATLLGTVYEFSTKDSPIPRRTLAPLLTQKLGRGKFLAALSDLRRHPAIRDADVDAASSEADLSKNFVDLFTLEYSRLRKAIDKDPGVEVLPASAAEAGVDRDVLDELRSQVQTMRVALAQAQQDALSAEQQAEQERMAGQKDLQTASAEVERLRRINQAMQAGHEEEVEKIAAQQEQQAQYLASQHRQALEATRDEERRGAEARLREHGAAAAQRVQELERRIAELGNAHRSEQAGHAETARRLEALTAQHAELGTQHNTVRRNLDELTPQHDKIVREHEQATSELEQARAELDKVKDESEKRQELVLRLTTTVKDLREEVKARDDELATERSGYNDLEKELESTKTALAESQKSSAASKSASAAPDQNDADKLSKLQDELSEAQEGEKSAKEELESMLLLLGELEGKRDGYKAKVKELGGEVTEDEDEDEEGDEEDGEEEGEEEGDVE